MGARPQTQSCPSQPCNKINIVTHRHKACYSKVNLRVCAKETERTLSERKRWSWGESVISVSSMHQKPSKLSLCLRGVKISSFNIPSHHGIATVALPALPSSERCRGFPRSQALESCLTFPLTPLPLPSLALTSRKPRNNEHGSSKGDYTTKQC